MTKTTIKKIGSYIYPDDTGYFPEISSRAPLPSSWEQALQDFIKIVRESYDQHLRSVYLRGSLVKGTMVDGFSDIDLLVVVNNITKDEAFDIRNSLYGPTGPIDKLLRTYPNITKYDLHPMLGHQVPKTDEVFKVLVKLFGVCVDGEDQIPQTAKLKPGKDVHYCVYNIAKRMEKTLDRLQDKEWLRKKTASQLGIKQSWMTRQILRAGMEVASESLQRHTRDLYFCHESIAELWPDFSALSRDCLEQSVNPNTDPVVILEKLKNLMPLIDHIISARDKKN